MSVFHTLWENHPTGEHPCSTNGKSNFENQCAIRMGVAFTKSGFDLKRWGIRLCWHHDKNEGHALAAEEMASALNRIAIPGLSKVETYKGSDEWIAKIRGHRGIVFFKDFYGTPQTGDHIDLWNGWRLTSAASLISLYTPLGSNYDNGRISFWPLV